MSSLFSSPKAPPAPKPPPPPPDPNIAANAAAEQARLEQGKGSAANVLAGEDQDATKQAKKYLGSGTL